MRFLMSHQSRYYHTINLEPLHTHASLKLTAFRTLTKCMSTWATWQLSCIAHRYNLPTLSKIKWRFIYNLPTSAKNSPTVFSLAQLLISSTLRSITCYLCFLNTAGGQHNNNNSHKSYNDSSNQMQAHRYQMYNLYSTGCDKRIYAYSSALMISEFS